MFSVWQPYLDIQKYDRIFFHHTNKIDAYHQYKLYQSSASRSCFLYIIFTGQKIVNSLQMKYLNLVKVHWVCAQQFHFRHSQAEAEAGKCFQILEFKLVLNSKEWRFPKPLLSPALLTHMRILLSDL